MRVGAVSSLPMTAQYFHLFSPVGLVANLLVVPLASLVFDPPFSLERQSHAPRHQDLGRINAGVASASDAAYLVVAGRPVPLGPQVEDSHV